MAKAPNEIGEALPTRDQELELHRRLIAGDHTATADLAAVFFGPLIEWLVSHNRRVPEDVCTEAAGEALVALMKDPASYKPHAKKALRLFAYLRMSAQGDLQNFLQREQRHHHLRISWESVEQSPLAGKYLGRDDDPSLALEIKEEAEKAAASVLPMVRDGLSEGELLALDLLEKGERRTAAYAEICGIGHLPVDQQRLEVKRLKDKLNQRIKRARPTNVD